MKNKIYYAVQKLGTKILSLINVFQFITYHIFRLIYVDFAIIKCL